MPSGSKGSRRVRVADARPPNMNLLHCIIHRVALAPKCLQSARHNANVNTNCEFHHMPSQCNAESIPSWSATVSLRGQTTLRRYSANKTDWTAKERPAYFHQNSPLNHHLTSPSWAANLTYSTFSVEKLNVLIMFLQGWKKTKTKHRDTQRNISDLITAFQRKLQRWDAWVEEDSAEVVDGLHDEIDS